MKPRLLPRLAWAAASIAAVFVPVSGLGGCDSFSLTELLLKPGEYTLSIRASDTTLQRGASTPLNVSGGVAPYSFSVAADTLSSKTPDTNAIGGVYNEEYVAGTAIGRIQVTVTDSENSTASLYVTVVPPTPAITGIYLNGDNSGASVEFNLNVSPPTSLLTGYRIERLPLGGELDFTDDVQNANATTYTDGTALASATTYVYRLYSLSDAFVSLPAEEQIASNTYP